MIKKVYLLCLFITCVFISCHFRQQPLIEVLLILDSTSSGCRYGTEYVVPYLDHFGIPYRKLDIGLSPMPARIDAALILLSHPGIASEHNNNRQHVRKLLDASLASGSGVVSFDPDLFREAASVDTVNVQVLRFSDHRHFIHHDHCAGDSLIMFGSIRMPKMSVSGGEVLIRAGDTDFLAVEKRGPGCLVHWATPEWMETRVLGPVAGLDGCFWRAIVWAARKPFVLRGLPALVTMRVDDVAGRGELFGQSPLYWVGVANRYGFKPWLGLFIYNLNPAAIAELRGYIQDGQATASPHAFGRPNRDQTDTSSYIGQIRQTNSTYYYNPQALPLRSNSYDEFIFFDHHSASPWSVEEMTRGLEAVSAWYRRHQSLPMSSYFVPHWYEFGTNAVTQISTKWNMEFIAIPKTVDLPYARETPWLIGGPFRLYEKPQSAWITRPVYYADFVEFADRRFFNCLTEIRDDAGYEWAPDNDVLATAGRGIRQLRRAFDAMALPVLFTHETDYIHHIRPENWDQALKKISNGIADYKPAYMTMDDALRIVRATKTSQLTSARKSRNKNDLHITFKGHADVATGFYLFTQQADTLHQEWISVPAFSGKYRMSVPLP